MKKKKRFAKLKKVLAGIMALALVVGLTIAGTLAYLSTQSSQVTNTFTATSDIKLEILEPNFNLDSNGSVINSTKPDPSKYIPNETYTKDPTLYNTSGDTSVEWVAMRVDYKISDTAKTLAELTSTTADAGGIVDTIDFDTTDWFLLTGSSVPAGDWRTAINDAAYQVYVFKYPIQGASGKTTASAINADNTLVASESGTTGIKTSPLFENVTIQSQTALSTNGYTSIANLPTFKIIAKGGALKKTEDCTLTSISSTNLSDTTKEDYNIVKALWDLLS